VGNDSNDTRYVLISWWSLIPTSATSGLQSGRCCVAVDLRKHLGALERLKTACSRIVGSTADVISTPTVSIGPEELRETAEGQVDLHISLSHTQPAAYTQRKTLLKGLRKACEGWRSQTLKLDAVQVSCGRPFELRACRCPVPITLQGWSGCVVKQ
jgi:hypothetical protein